MREEDWETIIALYQYQNLTKAAASLYMSQPTMTKQLARIEQDLGTVIVHRDNKGISFTPEGEYLVQQARAISDLLHETRVGLLKMRRGLSGTLSIGTASSYARNQLSLLLQSYTEVNPKAHFKVKVMVSRDVLKAVQDGTIHVGFVNGDREHNEKKVLCSCGTAYAVAATPFEKEDLLHMDMIMHNRDEYTRSILANWWNQNFDQPMPIGIVVQDIDTCINWIKSGLGFGMIFSNCLSETEKFYRYPLIDADGTPVRRNTWAVCRRDWEDYPLIADFIGFIEARSPQWSD